MKEHHPSFDIIVLGAGIIGSMIAFHAQNHGLKTALLGVNKVGQASHTTVGIVRSQIFNLPIILTELITEPGPQNQYTDLNEQILQDIGLSSGCRQLPIAVLSSSAKQSLIFEDLLKTEQSQLSNWSLVEPFKLVEKIPQIQRPNYKSVYTPASSIIDSQLLCDAIALKIAKHGGWVNRNLHTATPLYDKNRSVGIRAIQGNETWNLQTNQVVIAAGIWTGELLPEAFELPIIQQYAHTLKLPNSTNLSNILVRDKLTIIPWNSDELLITTTEQALENEAIHNNMFRKWILNSIGEIIPSQKLDNIKKYSISRLSSFPDRLPAVGKTTIEGLQVATGHDSLGITLACETARTIVSNIIGGQSTMLEARCSPLRYL